MRADIIKLARQYERYGYYESFNPSFRNELLNGKVFYTLKEAEMIIEQWPKHYNTIRLHSSLNWQPPTPEGKIPMDQMQTLN